MYTGDSGPLIFVRNQSENMNFQSCIKFQKEQVVVSEINCLVMHFDIDAGKKWKCFVFVSEDLNGSYEFAVIRVLSAGCDASTSLDCCCSKQY